MIEYSIKWSDREWDEQGSCIVGCIGVIEDGIRRDHGGQDEKR